MLEHEIPCIHCSVISFELVCILETLLKELLYLQKYKFFSIVFFFQGMDLQESVSHICCQVTPLTSKDTLFILILFFRGN